MKRDVPNLNTAIENRLIPIVNLTSLPALNAFGSIKLNGHKNTATPICIQTKTAVSSFVASGTLYIEIKEFWNKKIIKAGIIITRYPINISFFT